MVGGLTPACAQACPTASIQFGPISDLSNRAQQRVQQLRQRGETGAYIYGQPGDGHTDAIGGLNAFFLLLDKPEVYGLPSRPTLPSGNLAPGWLFGIGSGIVAGVLGLLSFRKRRMDTVAAAGGGSTASATL